MDGGVGWMWMALRKSLLFSFRRERWLCDSCSCWSYGSLQGSLWFKY